MIYVGLAFFVLWGLFAVVLDDRRRRVAAERALLFARGEARWWRKMAEAEATRAARLSRQSDALIAEARAKSPSITVGRHDDDVPRNERTFCGLSPLHAAASAIAPPPFRTTDETDDDHDAPTIDVTPIVSIAG